MKSCIISHHELDDSIDDQKAKKLGIEPYSDSKSRCVHMRSKQEGNDRSLNNPFRKFSLADRSCGCTTSTLGSEVPGFAWPIPDFCSSPPVIFPSLKSVPNDQGFFMQPFLMLVGVLRCSAACAKGPITPMLQALNHQAVTRGVGFSSTCLPLLAST